MITVFDVSVSSDWEAGNVVEFRCPNCGSKVKWARSGWWKPGCSCGYQWDVELYAYTTDDEKEKE